MASYNYSKTTDFTEPNIILSELQQNVQNSSISSATILYITISGDVVTFYFSGALSGPDQTTLTGLCSSYANFQRPVSSSVTTGDFTVAGGIGIGSNMWLGAAFKATNTTVAGSVLNIPAFIYTSTSTTPSNVNIASINQITIAETNATTTIANAASLYIANAPLAGTNVSAITNAYALQIAAGKTYLGGALQIATGASNGYILTSDASGNATWQTNSFSGGFADGTSALPGIFFSGQPGTGFYRPGSGQIGVELAGANYATFTTTGLNLVTGSTLNVGSSGTTSPANIYGLITGSNGLTISAGVTTLQTTTAATSSTAAALVVSGGVAVAKNMWIGTNYTGAVLTSNSTNGILFHAPAITMTDNALAAGTTTNINVHTFGQTTIATTTNAITATTAATLYIANAPAQGTNVTITTPYALQVAAGDTLLGGNLTVSGNFTVTGTTTSLNVTNVNSTDPLIQLGSNNVADTFDIGFFGKYVSAGTKYAGMIRQAGTNNFYIFSAYTTDITSATSVSSVSSFVANLFLNTMTASATTNQIVLGTTNTITITAPAPGASRTYTIPDAGGPATFIMSTFGSTQTIAGGLISSGLLIASNGFTLTTGALNLTSTSGAISLSGTSFTTNSAISTTATTGATSSTTGALIVSGGVGIAKNMWIGAAFTGANATVDGSVFNIPAFSYTSSTTSPTNVNVASINQVTLVGTGTATNAASLYIAGAPIPGAPLAITNPYALQIAAGKTFIGGALQIPTGATNGYILTSDASGNATWQINSFTGGFADGTSALPGIFFSTQPGTGFYRPGSGQIGVELAGTNYATFTTTGFTTANQHIISATTNQLVLGTTNTTTITSPAPAAPRTYTIPDAGGAATFIMSTFGSAQTIAGGLTSSGTLIASNGFTLTTGALNLTSTSGAISLTGTSFTTNSAISTTATTGATSSTTGALIVSGGVGIAKNIWVGAAFTSTNATVDGSVLNIPSFSYTSSTTSPTNVNVASINQVTLVGTGTATNAASLYIAGAPIPGAPLAITNPYALQIAAGKTFIGGALQIPTGAAANQVLTSDASGNASWGNPVIYYSVATTTSLTTTSTSLIAMSGITLTLVATGTYQITLTGNFYNQSVAIRSSFDIYNSTAAATIANSSFSRGGTSFQNANNYAPGTLNIVVIATISTPSTVIQGRFATSSGAGAVTMISSGVPGAGTLGTTSLIAVRLGA